MMKQELDTKKAIAQKLKSFAPYLNYQDKIQAGEQLNIHINTVGNYLQGKVADVKIGLSLIEAFKPIVENLLKRLNKAIAA